MQVKRIPRIMIAAASSGSGKTTLTCGLLQVLLSRGLSVSSFKCGPDYIDPMFHRKVIGATSGNLDLFLLGKAGVKRCLGENGGETDVAVLEGVMGYYDGIGLTTRSSSYEVACVTKTPVILLVDCKGMSLSVAALVSGFARFREDSGIVGVILNRLSPALYPQLKDEVERETGVAVLGYLPKLADCALESRHLGLVTADEVENLREKLACLGKALSQTVDVKGILRLAAQAPPLCWKEIPQALAAPVSIGVARDRAFCFYYEDALDCLTRMGAKLVPFSPLEDKALPQGISGFILGGGYPELYAQKLSQNASMRGSIRHAIENGMPCIAECGGFLYLGESLTGEDGEEYPMAGALPGRGFPTGRLRRFGYQTLVSHEDSLLLGKGESLPAHEFHYYDSTDNGRGCTAYKASRQASWECIHVSDTLFAGFPHIHLGGNPDTARRFLERCAAFEKRSKI